MTRFCCLELLESRVAPAALVTLTLTGHDLLIGGDNGGAAIVLEQLAGGEFVFSSQADTLFKLGAADPASLVFVKGVTGAVTVNLGSGSDLLDFHDVRFAKDLTVNTGAGSDIVTLKDARVGGSLNVNGGANSTQLLVDGLVTGRNLSVQAGDGQNSFVAGGLGLSVGGDASFVGGTDVDDVTFAGGPVKIKGNLSLDGGANGASTFKLTPSQLSVGRAFMILDSLAASTFNISPGGTLKVGGALEVQAGDGTGDSVSIGVGSKAVIAGSLLVNQRFSPGGDVTITPGALLQIAGDLTVQHGNSNHSTVKILAEVVRVGGGLSITDGFSGAGGPHISLGAATSFSVGKDLGVLGGNIANPGPYDVRVDVPGKLTVGGNLTISAQGSGAAPGGETVIASIDAGTAKIGQNLSFSTTQQVLVSSISGGVFTVGGSVGIESGNKVQEQISLRSLKVGHDFTVAAGTSLVSLDFEVTQALNIGGDLKVTSSAGGDEIARISAGSGKIAGNATVTLFGNHATLDIAGHRAPLTIGGNAAFTTAVQLSSTTTIQGLIVKRNFTFGGILGNDLAYLDDLTVNGLTVINTGSGSDTIAIETLATVLHRASSFARDTVVELGASAPATLRIGIAGDAQRRATFGTAADFHGGAGNNDTLKALNAVFLRSGEPTVVGFEL